MGRARVGLYIGLVWAIFVVFLSLGSVAIGRLADGGPLGIVVAALVAIAMLSSLRASLAMSRAVLAGREPGPADG